MFDLIIKNAGADYNVQHPLKSLTYFADAEADEMPQMLADVLWEYVKKNVEDAVKQYAARILQK